MEFLSMSRRCSSARNVPSGEERGEMDVFAGYVNSFAYHCTRHSPDLKDSKQLLGLNVFKKALKTESSLAKHLIYFCN